MHLNKVLKGPKVNRVIKYFVFSDLALFAGWGFVAPIFSIFVVDDIIGATLITVGISSAVYWFTRSLMQPPLAKFLDDHKGERDDFYVLIGGLLFTSLSGFLFALISTTTQLYALQLLYGAAMGAYTVAWSAIFSRHLDKDRIAFDWSLDRAAVGVAVGVTSLVGGVIASKFGFDAVFIISGILSFVSAVIIFIVPDLIIPPSKKEIHSVYEGKKHSQSTQTIH